MTKKGRKKGGMVAAVKQRDADTRAGGMKIIVKMGDQQNGTGGAIVAVGEARSVLPKAGGDGITTHTVPVGIIVPPPDIRAIADKTAAFVARNGMLN